MRSDAELLAAARRDPAAFRELYDRHAARVHAFHLRRSRDAEAALDLTAETFAQAWLSRARFRDEAGGSALPWLFGIARNVLAGSVRKRVLERDAITRLCVLERLDREPAAAAPDPSWLEGLDADLAEALGELPEQQQDALRLRIAEDLPYAAVAERQGTTPLAARVRVHRGLATLRTRLDERSEGAR